MCAGAIDHVNNLTGLMNNMLLFLRGCAGINEASLDASQRAWEVETQKKVEAASAQMRSFTLLYRLGARTEALNQRIDELFAMMRTLA